MSQEMSLSETLFCKHCSDEIKPNQLIQAYDFNFCCNGCKTVFSILSQEGLSKFYDLRSLEEFNPAPVTKDKANFDYMNDPNFFSEFVQTIDEKTSLIKFYLEGVHCMACIWLIEKTPSIIKGLKEARLNITDSTAEFKFSKEINISTIAQALFNIGYYPHPIALGEDSERFYSKEERSEILKIGIAAASMGNIMIYAVSNYAGADGIYKTAFNWISFILCLPVVFYSALPFYQTSLQAIKLKTISIDIPIAIAIIVGFVFSALTLFTGSDHNYFDSITALVFLILISRYYVKKATRQGLSNKGLNTIFSNTFVTRIVNGLSEEVHSKFINRGDTLKIFSDEKIVFDGKLLSSNAEIDNSIISGESRPCRISEGEDLFAGSVNLSEEILMYVEKVGNQTKLGKIISSITSTDFSKNKIVNLADKISKHFVWLVTLLTTTQFIYLLNTSGLNDAIERALAIVIISCPCALALATPLAYVKALRKLKNLGIFVKDENVLERIYNSKHVFLDKTGTLTQGKFSVISFENLSLNYTDEDIHTLVNSLEKVSTHPIAISLKKYFKNKNISNFDHCTDFKDIKILNGLGVELKNIKKNLFFGKLKEQDRISSNYTQVGLYENEVLVARYIIGDEIKDSSYRLIEKLKKLGKEIHILSGDNFQTVDFVAKNLEIANYHSDLSPEDKAQIISRYNNSIMIGDGINDVLAFKKANVSVAVSGSADLSLRASDVFMTCSGLSQIFDLIATARETRIVLIRNFVFSIAYNVIGVSLALTGHITPLWAAVFMPMSSFTVLISSFVGLENLRNIIIVPEQREIR